MSWFDRAHHDTQLLLQFIIFLLSISGDAVACFCASIIEIDGYGTVFFLKQEITLMRTNVRWKKGVDWFTLASLILFHIGAVVALFFFTWGSLAIAVILALLTGWVGVGVGYHRYLTHGSFKTYKPIRIILAFIGQLSGESSALNWVTWHRQHHQFSDQVGKDPHSPREGFLWAHVLWLLPKIDAYALHVRYAPDLLAERSMRFLHKTYIVWHVLLTVGLFLLGWMIADVSTGISYVLWGMILRMVVSLHMTWFVNSATHFWGYQNYRVGDDSRNNWLVALPTGGEGWHNNHHAHPTMARHGHRWYECLWDPVYWIICSLRVVHLAWDVKHDTRTVAS